MSWEWILGTLISAALATFGLAVSRPALAKRVLRFVEAFAIGACAVSFGALTSSIAARFAVVRQARDFYGADFAVTTGEDLTLADARAGTELVERIASAIDPLIRLDATIFGISGLVLLCCYAGTRMAVMSIEDKRDLRAHQAASENADTKAPSE